MTGSLNLLSDVCDLAPIPVELPDGAKVTALKAGKLQLGNGIYLNNVLFVPNLHCTLISVSKLAKELNCLVTFVDELCVTQDRNSRTLIGAGEQRDGVYFFRAVPRARASKVTGVDEQELWHRRLGHPSRKLLSFLPVVKSRVGYRDSGDFCDICLRAKQTRESFPLSINKTDDCFSLIHVDLWGAYRTPSTCGAVYFLTIVDDFSRAVWVYLLLEKREVERIVRNFCAMVDRQFKKKVKSVRSDNGAEFLCLKSYFEAQGILHQTSCVATPQQNGRVERKHRHILNVARALRFQANLPVRYWGECVLTASYLINRTPSMIHGGKTPYELLYRSPPPFGVLRTFGCLCYAHRMDRSKDKFGARSRKCIFLGYPHGTKGWRVCDVETGEIFLSRDVVFSEMVFRYGNAVTDNSSEAPMVDDAAGVDESAVDVRGSETVSDVVEDGVRGSAATPVEVAAVRDDVSGNATSGSDDSTPTESAVNGEVEVSNENLGRGHRQSKPSVLLKDFVTYNARCLSDPVRSTPDSRSGSSGKSIYPLAHYITCDRFSARHRAFLAHIDTGREPTTFSEAVKDKRWRDAMGAEIEALEKNGTWTLVSLPKGKRAIGSKWVYKIKHKSDGSIERYKARLVVLGNNQREGIDYTETFAPVAKMDTLRTFLAVAAAKNWELHQMDVNNAFLHGDLSEEVYMKLPPGFVSQDSTKVCRLRKSLYGLRQAPRCWFTKLATALKDYGFSNSYSDYSLFTYAKNSVRLHILVYVDDLVVAGNNSKAVKDLKDYLGRCFHMKDLGVLKYFLGIEVSRGQKGIFLCQRKYALDIVAETGFLGAKPAIVPIEQNHKLALSTDRGMEYPERYRRLVGRLIYLTITRPELSYAVHTLAQFMQDPRVNHWDAALRVVRYLKGRPGQGILLHSDSNLQLHAYCDSDWASCPVTRRSLTGYFVLLGGSPIAWKTKKQHTVSRSSAEAEYRSMATTCAELKWLKGLLHFLGIPHERPMRLFCDSQAALHIAANPVFHERTKHIEIDCHFIRDEIQKGAIATSYVWTRDQLADILTKALGRPQFDRFLRKSGILDLHAPT